MYLRKLKIKDAPLMLEWMHDDYVCPENQMCRLGYQVLKESGYLGVAQGSRGYNDLEILSDTANNPGSWFNLKRMGINKEYLLKSAEKYGKSPYGLHLKAVASGQIIF